MPASPLPTELDAAQRAAAADLSLLADAIAAAVWRALEPHNYPNALRAIHGQGLGDTTFGLDVEPEALIAAWAEDHARRAPLSVLTEDRGWRHLVPGGAGGWTATEHWDHGGPRVIFDPVDGTRPLMLGLRSAYLSIAWAAPGPEAPRLADVELAMLHELPTRQAAQAVRWLGATTARGPQTWRAMGPPGAAWPQPVYHPHRVDSEVQLERACFSFFRFHPNERVALAELEARFLTRLETFEGVNLDHVFDDQYTSNCAQLALITTGSYRLLADLRAWLAHQQGRIAIATKPYDIAAATLIARGAGAVVHDAHGRDLDVVLDAVTPLSFVAYANAATAARLSPHILAAQAR